MSSSEETEPEPPGADKKDIMLLLERLKGAIWVRRPILGEIMLRRGQKPLYAYSQDFFDINPSPLLDQRKGELIDIVYNLLNERLGTHVAEGVKDQLEKLPLVSTADHHGPLNHPFFVNSNIITTLPYFETADRDIKYLVNFSFSSISSNNSSFPRGILFHGGEYGIGELIRIPVLPDKLKMSVVYKLRAFNKEDMNKAISEIDKNTRVGRILNGRGEKVKKFLKTFFANEEVLEAKDLCTQITKINFDMWPHLFHPEKTSKEEISVKRKSKKIPDLIYLEIETIVKELLIKHHLFNIESLIHRMLFHKDSQRLVHRYFDKMPGAFSIQDGWGTYMFWAVDDKMHRVRLQLDKGKLHSRENTISIKWDAESLKKALEEKLIFPNMSLCYLMISLYYGMKCLGGFSQVNDLTLTKDAWKKYLVSIGEFTEAEALNPVQTKELGGDGMVLAYLKTPEGVLVPAMAIDMILEKHDTSYKKYVELSKKLILHNTMAPMLPEIYNVLYSSYERDPQLAGIKADEIVNAKGFYDDIKDMF
ncbi:MAG: hypothetical protein WC269_04990 [Candidatus Gracilibacteria bacterium]|jgi:hypothetical protein